MWRGIGAVTAGTGCGLFRSRVWVKATRQVGLPDLHFHDLRHTGNMLTAATGATLRELMDRMGHSTTRAALIYLHGSMPVSTRSRAPSATRPGSR